MGSTCILYGHAMVGALWQPTYLTASPERSPPHLGMAANTNERRLNPIKAMYISLLLAHCTCLNFTRRRPVRLALVSSIRYISSNCSLDSLVSYYCSLFSGFVQLIAVAKSSTPCH